MQYNTYSFKDLLSVIIDNRGKTCPTEEYGFPLIATNCVKNETLYPAFEKIRFVSQTTYDDWFRGHPEAGDMIFVCKGSPGNVCWTPDPVPFCIAQDMVAIRADEKKVYPKYLFALLRSTQTQRQISNMHVGTLIPHFKKGDFDKLFLRIPTDYGVQKQIGELYFDFCLKINLNRRMNETLEAMVRTVFKSWFVDFDPVKAKMEGKQPAGMDAETASLFPDKLVESELGMIPEGWEQISLSELISIKHGFAFKGEYFSKSPTQNILLTPGNFRIGGGFKDDKLKYYSGPIPEDYILSEGDLLVSMTDLSKASDTLGYPAFVPTHNNVLFLHNQRLGKITLQNDRVGKGYIYQHLCSPKYRNEILAGSSGTTVKHTAPKKILAYKIAFSGGAIEKAFESFFAKFNAMVQHNNANIVTLTNLREVLMPKLISGELSVAELEKKLGEV